MRTKLLLLLGFCMLAILATAAFSASMMQQRMRADRIEKLQTVVETITGYTTALERQVAAGTLDRAQAMAKLREVVYGMRFDGGAGYLTVQRLSDNVTVVHATDPSRENLAVSQTRDASGRSVTDLIHDALQAGPNGVIEYLTARPGQTKPAPKISYVARFEPWGISFLAGAYIDDLQAEMRAQLLRLGSVAGGILVITLLAAWLVERDITVSLRRLKVAMERLAQHDLATEIPGAERGDEVGGMAKAVLVFRQSMAETERLTAAQEEQRRSAELDKHAALVRMAEAIERETDTALARVGSRIVTMTSTADDMHGSAARTGSSAETAAGAASEALASAQTVASAAEQLSGSIQEIGRQVSQSSDVVGREVKALANQTARSTEEITRRIGDVRTATGAAVAAVERIEETIRAMDAIAGSIAAAVEEQGAATSEIARSVGQTAAAAQQMAGRIEEVSAEAKEAHRRAGDLHDNTNALKNWLDELKQAVVRVVRNSSMELERRQSPRVTVDLAGQLFVSGQAPMTVRVVDLSEGGAGLADAPELPANARGSLQLAGLDVQLPFQVRSGSGGRLHLALALDEATAPRYAKFLQRAAAPQSAAA